MRCVHEASLHNKSSFLTLTYDDKHLPQFGSLQRKDLTKFLKRLRYELDPFRISYYACGEYGDETQRPHYHVCLFGHDFPDKTPFKKTGEHTLYISKELNNIWGHGNTSIGDLTFETAAYTARYTMKKIVGRGCQRYVRLDTETGELIPLEQPFAAMSLRPAIAKLWLRQYAGDLYNNDKDFLYMRGRKMRPTKYYDALYDTINPAHMAEIKEKRKTKVLKLTDKELRAREKNTRARIKSKKEI